MFHVILVILKVIGIILGGLLALFLLLLGIVLFVPVRYRIRATKYETIQVKAKASWLCHIIDVRFRFYQEEETYSYCIRIFGYPFIDSNRPPRERKEKKPRRTREEKRAEKKERKNALDQKVIKKEKVRVDTTSSSNTKEIETQKQVVVLKTTEEARGNTDTQEVKTELIRNETESIKSVNRNEDSELIESEKNVGIVNATKDIEETESEVIRTEITTSLKEVVEDDIEKESIVRKILKPFRVFYQKVAAIPRKIKESIQRLRRTLRAIKDKVHHVKEMIALVRAFFDDEENRKGLKCVFHSLKKTLKHMLPYRIKGILRIGLEDPCDTGMLLGGLSIFYPLYENKIEIIPDFQEEVLEGKVDAKGRIRACTLFIIGIKLLLDDNFKKLLKNAKELKEEF